MVTKEFMDKVRWSLEETITKGNVDAMGQIDSPDVVLHSYPFPEYKGLQAVKQMFSERMKGFSDIHIDFEEMISEGDTIASRYTIHSKHTGTNPMFQAPPTGKDVTLKGCFFAHSKDDKNVEVFEYCDSLGFLQQLGIVPPMGQQ